MVCFAPITLTGLFKVTGSPGAVQEQALRAWARNKVMARLMVMGSAAARLRDMGRGSAGENLRGSSRGSARVKLRDMGWSSEGARLRGMGGGSIGASLRVNGRGSAGERLWGMGRGSAGAKLMGMGKGNDAKTALSHKRNQVKTINIHGQGQYRGEFCRGSAGARLWEGAMLGQG